MIKGLSLIKGVSAFSSMQGCPLDGNSREYIPLIKKNNAVKKALLRNYLHHNNHSFTTYAQFTEKQHFLTPDTHTCM